MRVLIDDTLVAAPFAAPLRAGWEVAGVGAGWAARPGLRAADVGADDAALLSTAEYAHLAATHAVVPAAAVVADHGGAVSLRTPVRADEVGRTPVRLADASGTAELLARAVVQPFYGIEPTAWLRDDGDPAAAEAQAVVVEGIAALGSAEGGFAEDLVRAWFILVGLPFVSHLLVAPAEAEPASVASVVDGLNALRAVGHERRREWRAALVEQSGVTTEALGALFAGQRHILEPDDRRAVVALFSRGARGSAYPPPAIRYLEAGGA